MSTEGSTLPDQNAPATGAVPVRKTRLQRLRWPLMSFAVIAVLGGGAYFYIKGSRYQSTDDAYAQAATVSISANVAGRVSDIEVRDNELVQRGATLLNWTTRRFASSSATPQRTWLIRGCKSSHSSRPIGSVKSSCTPRKIRKPLHSSNTIDRRGSSPQALRRRRSSIRLLMRSMRRANKWPTCSSRSASHSRTSEDRQTLRPSGILWSPRRRPPLIERSSTYHIP